MGKFFAFALASFISLTSLQAFASEAEYGALLPTFDFGYSETLSADQMKVFVPQAQALVFKEAAVTPSVSDNLDIGWQRYMLMYSRGGAGPTKDMYDPLPARRGLTVPESIEEMQEGIDRLNKVSTGERVQENREFITELFSNPLVVCQRGRIYPSIDNPNVSDTDHIVRCQAHRENIIDGYTRMAIFGVDRISLQPYGVILLIGFPGQYEDYRD